ncbi:uncharacterized protein LOC117901095 [Drosophila subobscura]|uniref:uncharacterized protein LOC117901095 n=1 Tax=Drosophila subobscura TaxID=7241 RepID=UPI00155A58A1|nr:uncharacterized protein LOC117901095 [Drosophila subobscura]
MLIRHACGNEREERQLFNVLIVCNRTGFQKRLQTVLSDCAADAAISSVREMEKPPLLQQSSTHDSFGKIRWARADERRESYNLWRSTSSSSSRQKQLRIFIIGNCRAVATDVRTTPLHFDCFISYGKYPKLRATTVNCYEKH